MFRNFKISSIFMTVPSLLFMPAAIAITCPAGSTADSLIWENQWTGSNDLVFGNQTFTSESGDVDVRVRVHTISGTGCDNSQMHTLGRSTYYSAFLPTDTLSIALNWPNVNCQVRLRLRTYLDGTVTPLDVNRLEYSLYDIDLGGSGAPYSWNDVFTFSPTPTNRYNGAGSSFTQTPTKTEAGINNCVNSSAADYERCRQTVSWDGPGNRFDSFYQSGVTALTDPNQQRIFISDVEFCTPSSLPVSLTSFSSKQKGSDNLVVRWETASELANAGFMIWGEQGDDWVALSPNLIASQKSTGHKNRKYRAKIKLSDDIQGITKIAISSIDTGGEEEFFGPFTVGDKNGEDTIPEPIEWSKYKASYQSRMRELGYQKRNNRWQKGANNTLHTLGNAADAHAVVSPESTFLSVDKPGFYRVTGQDLLDQGWNLNDINWRDIAVVHKGQSVARDIVFAKKFKRREQKVFSAKDSIVFYAKGVSEEDSIYVDAPTYEIKLDSVLAQKIPLVGKRPKGGNKPTQYATDRHTYTIEQDTIHNTAVKAANPWMMHQFFTYYGESEQTYRFDLSSAPLEQTANLKLELHTVSDFPAVVDPDTNEVVDEHRIIITVNGTTVADETTNDTVAWPLDIDFDAQLLTTGENQVTVIAPGVGEYFFDMVLLDSISLTVTQPVTNNAENVQFTALSQSQGHTVKHTYPTNSKVLVYAFNDNGNVVKPRSRLGARMRNENGVQEKMVWVGNVDLANAAQMNYRVGTLNSIAGPLDIWTQGESGLDIDLSADYVIVVEDSLSEELEKFVQHRQQSGYKVAVYRYSNIVEEFGFGYRTPDAIKNFLYELSLNTPISHVLLVGGHTYDYLNKSNAEIAPINLLPAFYRASSELINSTPTDLPFVDFDDDGAPELAIGRWPVRDAVELSTIIDKTMAFEAAAENGDFGLGSNQKALLIAGQESSSLYKNMNHSMAQRIGGQANDGSIVQPWRDLSFVHLDDYAAEPGNTNNQAREDIITKLNEGQKLTVFTGHGSTIRWSKQNLFTTESVKELQNIATPTSIITLACYTTYYETLATNTLAHQFLFSEGGAALLMGAPMLGEPLKIRGIIANVLDNAMQGYTVGEAVKLSLRQSIENGNGFKTTINWSLLGDPALRLHH